MSYLSTLIPCPLSTDSSDRLQVKDTSASALLKNRRLYPFLFMPYSSGSLSAYQSVSTLTYTCTLSATVLKLLCENLAVGMAVMLVALLIGDSVTQSGSYVFMRVKSGEH